MRRVRNWDVKIVQWCGERQGAAFVWGETDCGSLVWEALSVMYDDLGPLEMPSYDSRKAALRAFSSVGDVGTNLMGVGAQEVDIAFARTGDVVCYHPEEGPPAAAVVIYNTALIASEEEGVRRVALSDFSEDVRVLRVPFEVDDV